MEQDVECRGDDNSRGAPIALSESPPPPPPLHGDELSRKWTELEEAALIAYWRANAAQFVTKTKRFFYDGAARIPALRRKSLGQIKSKCFDIEKRYRDITNAVRANGAAASPGTERDAQLRWILKKFPLYYDVQPFLRERQVLASAFSPERASPSPSTLPPLAAGVPSFAVPPLSGKKRALTGGAPPPMPTQSPRAPTKRPRAEIERLAKASEDATANAAAVTAPTHSSNVGAAPSSGSSSSSTTETLPTPTAEVHVNVTPVATPVKNAAAPSAAASPAAFSPASSSPYVSLQMHESREMMEAAAQKLRAEATIATIRAHAALLRERKALLDEGVAVHEIDALLPLQSIL